MPVIVEHAPYVTQINHIRVAPENIGELVAKMRNQFEAAAQLGAVHQADAFNSLFEGHRSLVIESGPHPYTVVRVLERPLPPAGADRERS